MYQAEPESKQIRAFMAAIGLDYDTLTKEEFVSIISGLKKSKHLKSPISQRGKTEETLKRGAALRRDEGFYIPLLPRRRKLHIPRFAASGKAHPFRCSSFPHKIFDFAGDPFSQSDFVSQKSCICVTLMSQNPPVQLRISSAGEIKDFERHLYCRRKASVNRYLPVQQMAKPTPFPCQIEAKV